MYNYIVTKLFERSYFCVSENQRVITKQKILFCYIVHFGGWLWDSCSSCQVKFLPFTRCWWLLLTGASKLLLERWNQHNILSLQTSSFEDHKCSVDYYYLACRYILHSTDFYLVGSRGKPIIMYLTRILQR